MSGKWIPNTKGVDFQTFHRLGPQFLLGTYPDYFSFIGQQLTPPPPSYRDFRDKDLVAQFKTIRIRHQLLFIYDALLCVISNAEMSSQRNSVA